MIHLFEMAYSCQHVKLSLNKHTGIPLSTLTDLQIRRIAIFGMETGISQNDHLIDNLPDKRSEHRIIDVGSITSPSDNQAKFVQKQTELSSNNPPMIGDSLLSDLPWAASFTDRVNKLNSITINNTQDGWVSQEPVSPIPMGLEEAEETSSLRQLWEEPHPVVFDPSIKCPVTYSLDGEQHCQCDNFTWIEDCFRVLLYIWHSIVYPTKQLCDKILYWHWIYLLEDRICL